MLLPLWFMKTQLIVTNHLPKFNDNLEVIYFKTYNTSLNTAANTWLQEVPFSYPCSLSQFASITMSHCKIAAIWTSIHVWDAYNSTLHIRLNFQNYPSTKIVFIFLDFLLKGFSPSQVYVCNNIHDWIHRKDNAFSSPHILIQ